MVNAIKKKAQLHNHCLEGLTYLGFFWKAKMILAILIPRKVNLHITQRKKKKKLWNYKKLSFMFSFVTPVPLPLSLKCYPFLVSFLNFWSLSTLTLVYVCIWTRTCIRGRTPVCFWVWITSFNIILSRSIHFPINLWVHFFLQLNNIQSCICTTFLLHILQLIYI